MIIDGNPIEKAAMEQFHNGNREKGFKASIFFFDECHDRRCISVCEVF